MQLKKVLLFLVAEMSGTLPLPLFINNIAHKSAFILLYLIFDTKLSAVEADF